MNNHFFCFIPPSLGIHILKINYLPFSGVQRLFLHYEEGAWWPTAWQLNTIKKQRKTTSMHLQCFQLDMEIRTSLTWKWLFNSISSKWESFFCHTIFWDNADDNSIPSVDISLSSCSKNIFNQENGFIFSQWNLCYPLLVFKPNLQNNKRQPD